MNRKPSFRFCFPFVPVCSVSDADAVAADDQLEHSSSVQSVKSTKLSYGILAKGIHPTFGYFLKTLNKKRSEQPSLLC